MNRNKHKGLALMLLAVSQFILALDYTIVFVALPSIGADLGFSTNHLQWVVSAYSLFYGGFLLIGGRLSDLAGRRRMLIIAMGLFGLGSLFGGLAHSQLFLIFSRVVQGLGGALLSPATLSLIMSNFEEGAERNRAMAVWSAMGGVGLSLGLLLGGVLTNYIGWEAIFFVNVPIVLLVMILSPVVLSESRFSSKSRHYDAAGAFSVTAGMLFIVYYLIQAPVEGWFALTTFIPGLAGVGLLLLFTAIELRTREPLVPFRLFRIRNLTGATLTAVLCSGSFGALYYFMTLYTQEVLHYSVVQSGLIFMPLTFSSLLATRFVNKLIAVFGLAGTVAIGMGLGAAGFMLFARLSAAGAVWEMIPGMLMIGVGQSFVFTGMYIAAGYGIDMKEQGVASAIVNTGQQIGTALGLAVILAMISSGLGTSATLGTMDPIRLTGAIRTAFVICAAIALLGILVAIITLKQKKQNMRDGANH
ncbi:MULTISPECIES: MFS transporter [unclassified Paenibacillus]|uniref:MFS transporter n=1 Tax=unclassified Paenibacillus TaxID=185978 RepID=UPI001C0FD262|nr:MULTISPECIES: MFS transporter [unclassified Paenibacillus]MBU5441325.1 MFS transporter [Paenibacillus sp. MSJ-34]